MAPRVRIGELLVDAGLLTQAQLDRALEEQRVEGGGSKRLGQLIVALGFVTEGQLARVLSQQLAVPWVSLSHIDFSPALLALVDREMAEKYTVIPVYVRRERRDVDTLYLAVDDPTQDDVLRIVSDKTKMPVRPMIAPPSDILHAIIRAYGPKDDFEDEPQSALFPLPLVKKPSQPKMIPTPIAGTPSPARATPPPPPPRPTPMPSPAVAPLRASPSLPSLTPDHPIERPVVAAIDTVSDLPTDEPTTVSRKAAESPPAPTSPPTTDAKTTGAIEPTASARSEQTPTPPAPVEAPKAPVAEKPQELSKPKQPKMISLTLLDGTTIQLPSKNHRAKTKRSATTDHGNAFDEPKTVAQAVRRESEGAAKTDARSIVAALRAATSGLSAEARAARWEGVVGALIEALVAKGALTEDELRAALERKG